MTRARGAGLCAGESSRRSRPRRMQHGGTRKAGDVVRRGRDERGTFIISLVPFERSSKMCGRPRDGEIRHDTRARVNTESAKSLHFSISSSSNRHRLRSSSVWQVSVARLGTRRAMGTKWKRLNFSFAPADGRRCAARVDGVRARRGENEEEPAGLRSCWS